MISRMIATTKLFIFVITMDYRNFPVFVYYQI